MRVLFRTAIIFDGAAEGVETMLTSALERRGFSARAGQHDPESEHLRAELHVRDDRTHELTIQSEASMMELARFLAAELSIGLEVHQVEVRDKLVRSSAGDELYWASSRSEQVAPDGATRGLGDLLELEDGGANHGDLWETADFLIWTVLEERLQGAGPTGAVLRTLTFRRLPDDDDLSERLRNLVVLAGEAESVSLTEVMGQQAVRIVLPDGSTQMSVLSEEELEQFRSRFEL